MVEQPATFCEGFPRSLRARIDQAAHDIRGAHKVGVREHLEEVFSMSFVQFRGLLMPCPLLELFPVPFVFRVDDERPPLQLQDHVGDERALYNCKEPNWGDPHPDDQGIP